jgi:hypothetical protein
MNDTTTETIEALLQCDGCGKALERKRSIRKGYKITQFGCLCDDCCPRYVSTRVYEYGCGDEYYGGFDGTELAIEQMRLANQLWNVLVELDRYERTEYRRLTTDPDIQAQIDKKEVDKEDLYTAIRRQKQLERTKRVSIPSAITEQLKQVRTDLKVLYTQNAAESARLKIANAPAIETLKAELAAKICAATDPKTCGLIWTMIGPLKSSFKTASAKAKKDGTMLRFHRFDGSGRIVVPFSNGLLLSDAHRSDEVGKFQIGTGLMSAHPRERRTLCRIAVSSINRKPVWLTLPVVFHRPLPADADIRSVSVLRSELAGKAHWKMCITVRTSAPKKVARTLACGIDIGWRKRSDGSIRVAYWVDENRECGELLFPGGDMAQFHKLDDLKSIMDMHFNKITEALIAGFKTIQAVPEVIHEAFQFMDKWKSPGRLVRAMNVWSQNRFPGDDGLWDQIHYWYYGPNQKPDADWNGHKHLFLWWVNLSDQLQRKRREQYRVFATGLTKKYGRVFIGDFDLRNVAETRSPELDTEYDQMARYQRTKAAPSVLRSAIENACIREGVRIQKVDALYSTHECPTCGAIIKFDAAKTLMCKCGGCGNVLDQDFIGAQNILNRGLQGDATAMDSPS